VRNDSNERNETKTNEMMRRMLKMMRMMMADVNEMNENETNVKKSGGKKNGDETNDHVNLLRGPWKKNPSKNLWMIHSFERKGGKFSHCLFLKTPRFFVVWRLGKGRGCVCVCRKKED